MNIIEETIKYLKTEKGFKKSEKSVGEEIICEKQRVIFAINRKTGLYEAKFASAVDINQHEAEVIRVALIMLNLGREQNEAKKRI